MLFMNSEYTHLTVTGVKLVNKWFEQNGREPLSQGVPPIFNVLQNAQLPESVIELIKWHWTWKFILFKFWWGDSFREKWKYSSRRVPASRRARLRYKTRIQAGARRMPAHAPHSASRRQKCRCSLCCSPSWSKNVLVHISQECSKILFIFDNFSSSMYPHSRPRWWKVILRWGWNSRRHWNMRFHGIRRDLASPKRD